MKKGKHAIWLAAGLLVSALGIMLTFGFFGYTSNETNIEVDTKSRQEASIAKDRSARDAVAKALETGTPADWDAAANAIGAIEDERTRDMLNASVRLARVESYARARDTILARAVEFARYNGDDPRIYEELARAKPFQDKVMELLKDAEKSEIAGSATMSPDELARYRAALLYQAGHANYSQLWFITQDNKTEANKVIAAALLAFQRANRYAARDGRTQHAIEALYEVQKNRGGGGGNSGSKKRPMLLPQASPNSNSGSQGPGI
jgi:hypothetical protein